MQSLNQFATQANGHAPLSEDIKSLLAPTDAFISAKDLPLLTVNYDTLLEEVLDRLPLDPKEDLDNDGEFFKESGFHHDSKLHSSYIVHLHGIYYDRGNFVLLKEQYNSTMRSFITFMKSVVKERRLIFLGCNNTIFDLHFLGLWKKEKEESTSAELQARGPHIVLVRGEQEVYELTGKMQNVADIGPWMVANVRAVSYGDTYDDLPGFLYRSERVSA